MKTSFLFIILLILNIISEASDEWQVFGINYEVKNINSQPVFAKWHKYNIGYRIVSTPDSDLNSLIDASFDTWENCGYIIFTSGNDISVYASTGENSWFGYGPFTTNSSGEITSSAIYLNNGTYGGIDIVWTDGNENSPYGSDPYYCDVQNCVTHELGHNLGIAHHSTGNGSPTMATRDQCSSFNTSLARRTLETDDWTALNFLYKNLYIPLEYSSINSALSVLPTNGTIIICQNYSLTDNSNISSTKTLTINAGITVSLGTFYISSTGGTINNYGNFTGTYLKQSGVIKGLFPTIQSAVNYASSGQTIELQARTYGESVSISSKSNLTITGQGQGSSIINGNISITNTRYDPTTIQNLSLINDHKISANGGIFTFSNITNNSNVGVIYTYNCGDFSITNLVSNGTDVMDAAVSLYNTSGGLMSNSTITDQLMGVIEYSGCSFHADNNYFCGNGNDFYVSGGYTHSCNNVFSRDRDDANYGDVIYDASCSQPDPCGSLRKSIAQSGYETKSNIYRDASSDIFFSIDESYYSLMQEIRANTLETGNYDVQKYTADLMEIIENLKSILDQYPETIHYKAILLRIKHCYGRLDKLDELNSYLTGLMKNDECKGKKEYAKRHMMEYYINTNQYDNAVLIADEVMSGKTDDADLNCEMLYEKGLIYQYNLSNIEYAKNNYLAIIQNYPEHPLTRFAGSQLENLGYSVDRDLKKVISKIGPELSSSSYPNPFNPTTTIQFGIPTEGNVTIKVFDIMGREVATLVNQNKQAGTYNVTWDSKDNFGNEVSSGIYFYNIRFKDQSFSKKMVLVR